MLKNMKGITLIALVVTIVVLLILAGVSINLILGDNGIISKSKEARDKYAQSQTNDKTSLDETSDWIEEQIGSNETDGDPAEEIELNDENAYMIGYKKGTTVNFNIPGNFKYNDKNYKITSIGEDSFRNDNSLRSIDIPNTVKEIGSRAFLSCPNIEEFKIPESLVTIGYAVLGNNSRCLL